LRGVFQTNEDTQRLLAPWLMVTESQISRFVDGARNADPSSAAGAGIAQQLPSMLELQRPAQAQRQFSGAVDILAEAATTDQDRRLPVLAFQFGRALGELDATAAGLDPKLRPLFVAQLSKLRNFAQGPNAITEARKQELALIGDGERRLTENATLSTQLTSAVDELAGAAKSDIDNAVKDAQSVQRLSTRVLLALVALSLLSSILVVWLYVGRNIVRRLTALSHGMLAIAGGKLDAGVATEGADEIAAMGRAVEVFRRNAMELARLLEERKQAAARLEQLVSERTGELERRTSVLRVTFDNMGQGVAMFDRDRRMVAWNHHFQELLDLPNDRVGPDFAFEDFIGYLARRGEFGPCNVEEEIGRRLASLDRAFVDERTRPNGTVLEVRRNPVPSGGFVSIYADVTEQKRAQALIELARARLIDAIESLSDGFALWDCDDRLIIFNSRCEELLNAPDLFVAGTRFEDLVRAFARGGRYDPSQATDGSWVDERLAGHRNPPSGCELRLANGRWLRVSEFRTGEGGTVTIWADITPSKQRERELEDARDRAAEASETMQKAYRELKAAQAQLLHAEKMASLGQVTAGIAHEIKNPLNFVNNFADLSSELMEELTEALCAIPSAGEARQELDAIADTIKANLLKIAQHGRRADSIVKNMLLHSREDTGERRAIDLNASAEEALNLTYHGTRAENPNFHIRLRSEFDPEVGDVEVCPQEFLRVLLNVISNGFYAARKRQDERRDASFQPELSLSTKGFAERVEIRVRDNGIGIPQEVKAKMFNPFFTTKAAGEGTGLGLSLSYDIVKQHGGSIEAESVPGEFTEFIITLPRRLGPGIAEAGAMEVIASDSGRE
jgi:signal transduction histidine kinase